MRDVLPLFFILLAFFSGLFIGVIVENKAFKNELLEQNHAYYHPQTGSGYYMVKDTTLFIYKISNNWKVGYKNFFCIKEKIVMIGSIIQLNELFETKKDALEFISLNGSSIEKISSESHNWDCTLKDWITK